MFNFLERKYWEGPYFDLWSVPHLFYGVLAAFIAVKARYSFKKGIVITTLLAIFWEFLEIYSGEAWEVNTNRIVDVLIADAGFIITWFYVYGKHLSAIQIKKYLNISIFLVIILNLIGWLNYIHYTFGLW